MFEGDETGDPQAPMTGWMAELHAAARFLTRLPVGGRDLAEAPGVLGAAAWSFPIVGLGVGLLAGLVYAVAAGLGLTGWPGAVLAVATQLLVTGALHEDGFADLADGLGGGVTRERKLAIMRDSRIGTYGVCALVLAITIRVAVIAELADPMAVWAALITAGAVSRTMMVGLMHALDPARPDGLGATAGRPDPTRVTVAFAIAAVVALVAIGFSAGLLALVAALVGAIVVGALARQQIGGQTGDVVGAVQQASEIACLLVVAAMFAAG